MLTPDQAAQWARDLLDMQATEKRWLDRLHAYWTGTQDLPVGPGGVPDEVKRLAEMSRINVCKLAVDVPAQAMSIVGFRSDRSTENSPTWTAWQANRMDKHQKPLFRGAFAYGTSYLLVLLGDPHPVIRPKSPRKFTAAYADPADDWPECAIEVLRDGSFHLYDATHRYPLTNDPEQAKERNVPFWPTLSGPPQPHGSPVCPVVRFQTADIEGTPQSEIEPVISLQDQMDATTFGLLVAQHFAAFRQRYVIGWTTEDEGEKAKASASRLWTFDDEGITVGEFGQTDLDGYLGSRKSTQELFGVISQVPPHNLLGQMVNLSAEALVAAEVGFNRKMDDLELSFGESVEQTHWLLGHYMGVEVPVDAQTRWRETEARSLAQTVDALGKMVQMLGIPAEALWERVPGATQQDVESWRQLLERRGGLESLFADLDRQLSGVN